MVVITKKPIIDFYTIDFKAKEPLLKWYYEVILADWQSFHDVKRSFNSVDSVGNDRYVFNIGGNKYRIVAMIHFSKRTIYIRFDGTHKQYDQINCKII